MPRLLEHAQLASKSDSGWVQYTGILSREQNTQLTSIPAGIWTGMTGRLD